MKFYVNQIHDVSDDLGYEHVYPNMLIGLFDSCDSKGEGYFSGWYGAEYYLNTKLYAHYIAEGGGYQPQKRISNVIIEDQPIFYEKVIIGSQMWTYVIEAETIDIAIELFSKGIWRKWSCEKDRI